MRKKILIHIGKVLAILVLSIPIFWCITYYYNYRAYTFWETAKSFDVAKLEELIHKEGYSPDTKVPLYRINAISILACTPQNDTNKAYATMKYLLDQGANPDNKNKIGMNNLYMAIFCHQSKLAKLLIMYGADINSGLRTYGSVHFKGAIITKQYDLAQYLLDHGAYTNKELYERFKREQKEASLKKTK